MVQKVNGLNPTCSNDWKTFSVHPVVNVYLTLFQVEEDCCGRVLIYSAKRSLV